MDSWDALTLLAQLAELRELETRANHLWTAAGDRVDRQAKEMQKTARLLDVRATILRNTLWGDAYPLPET